VRLPRWETSASGLSRGPVALVIVAFCVWARAARQVVNRVLFPERDEAAACGWFYLVSPSCFGLHLVLLLCNGKPVQCALPKSLIVPNDVDRSLTRSAEQTGTTRRSCRPMRL
jgi:hypothetical protein